MDVFVPGASMPVRIEFFDDEVDSLRMYDPMSQRSSESPESISIYPAQLVVRSDAENARAAAVVLWVPLSPYRNRAKAGTMSIWFINSRSGAR